MIPLLTYGLNPTQPWTELGLDQQPLATVEQQSFMTSDMDYPAGYNHWWHCWCTILDRVWSSVTQLGNHFMIELLIQFVEQQSFRDSNYELSWWVQSFHDSTVDLSYWVLGCVQLNPTTTTQLHYWLISLYWIWPNLTQPTVDLFIFQNQV